MFSREGEGEAESDGPAGLIDWSTVPIFSPLFSGLLSPFPILYRTEEDLREWCVYLCLPSLHYRLRRTTSHSVSVYSTPVALWEVTEERRRIGQHVFDARSFEFRAICIPRGQEKEGLVNSLCLSPLPQPLVHQFRLLHLTFRSTVHPFTLGIVYFDRFDYFLLTNSIKI